MKGARDGLGTAREEPGTSVEPDDHSDRATSPFANAQTRKGGDTNLDALLEYIQQTDSKDPGETSSSDGVTRDVSASEAPSKSCSVAGRFENGNANYTAWYAPAEEGPFGRQGENQQEQETDDWGEKGSAAVLPSPSLRTLPSPVLVRTLPSPVLVRTPKSSRRIDYEARMRRYSQSPLSSSRNKICKRCRSYAERRPGRST